MPIISVTLHLHLDIYLQYMHPIYYVQICSLLHTNGSQRYELFTIKKLSLFSIKHYNCLEIKVSLQYKLDTPLNLQIISRGKILLHLPVI